jgi:DNA-binding transcriptional regulator YhcF (GntR family)
MIDPMSGEPLYQQLARLLRDQITSGKIKPRTPLPSAKTLAQQHQIAVGTVMRAFDVRAEGLVRTIPGRGVWVIEQDSPSADRPISACDQMLPDPGTTQQRRATAARNGCR